MIIQPRLLRLRDAPAYLGMNINYFNAEVRPHLVTIRIGTQGIAFDRLDLDAFAEQYKHRNERHHQANGGSLWDAKKSLDSSNVGRSGISKSKFSDEEFERVLAQGRSNKPKFT